MGAAIALAIQGLALATQLYRKGYQVTPDGRRYLAMGRGGKQPSPYARRWLMPAVIKANITAWKVASGVAFLACGPLMYELTGSLACVWLMAWLPGLLLNVRLPVLTDQCAIALMLGSAVAYQHGHLAVAMALLFASGQCKESAPVFGVLLCPHWLMGVAALMSVLGACGVGVRRGGEPDAEHQFRPFRTARAKHDPFKWTSMLLPWGGVAVMACVAGLELNTVTVLAGVSLAVAYGQLLIANDEVRLYQWAAPAVLVALAPYMDGPWLVPALVAHPFLANAGKQS